MIYRYVILIAVLSLNSCRPSLTAADVPPLPASSGPIVESGNYPSDQAARSKWDPQDKSQPLSAVAIGGRKVLQMSCLFRDKPGPRFSWDRALPLDLARASGIQFKFYCPDATPVSGFSFYLHSGEGWYAARFEHTNPDGWTTVNIFKPETTVEGTVAGWARIDRIRISAWRGADQNTSFYVADIGPILEDSPVALIRAESILATPRHANSASVSSASALLSDHLHAMGIRHVSLSDLDVSDSTIRNLRLLILPFNPEMPAPASDAIATFLKSGGHIMTFYQVPGPLQSLIGIRLGRHVPQSYAGHFASIRPADRTPIEGLPPVTKQMSWNIVQAHPIENVSSVAAYWYSDKGKNTGEPAIVVSPQCVHMTHVMISDDPGTKQVLLLALAGHSVPGLWKQAAEHAVARIGRIGPYTTAPQAEKALLLLSSREPVPTLIRRSTEWREDALQLLRKEQFPTALQSAAQARLELVRAYSAVQTPPHAEFRGAWCHNAFGVEGMDWDQAVRILADNGFNAVLPNMAWGGTAYYRSSVLPVSPLVADKGDQLALCAAACRKYGVECHVWKVCWNMADRAPEEFVARMKKQGRLQANANGKTQEHWLCPSHPANQQLEVDALVEIARNYDVAGVHMDYIRYPGSESCFCEGCRERFEKSAGVPVKDWPRDVRNDSALSRQWLQFRRDHITHTVTAARAAVKKIRPKCSVSAAVFVNWPTDRDTIGQDWKLWCDKGYLDFVCPMDYTDNDLRFEQMAIRQKTWAGRTPCYPGIGLSTWSDRGNPVRLMDQINITRRIGAGGFTIFQYRESEAREVLPVCGLGATRKARKQSAPANQP